MTIDFGHPLLIIVLLLLVVWEGIWKGIALWRAGRDGSIGWFVVMFIINTVGILEIIYIFAVSNPKRRAAVTQ